MLGLRQTVLTGNHSLISMRIVGSEVMWDMYSTRLGETHMRGLFDCTNWVRPVDKARLVMIKWVRPGGN